MNEHLVKRHPGGLDVNVIVRDQMSQYSTSERETLAPYTACPSVWIGWRREGTNLVAPVGPDVAESETPS